MDILVLLIPLSVVLVLVIGAGFWWSVTSGQFDDLEGPAHRILADDDTSDVIPAAPTQCSDVAEQHGELTSIKCGPDNGR
jgi:cbb3-type cytochrome oxidase maturation protein